QATSQPSQATQPAATTISDLESLLSEFTRETAPKEAPKTEQQRTPQKTLDQAAFADPNAFREYMELSSETGALRQRVGEIGGIVHAMNAEALRQRDISAFDGIVGKADKLLQESGLAMGDEWARRWLIAEAQLNPALAQAFDQRHQSPDRFARQEKKVMERLLKAAKSQPDPEATANRMAVAAAVRGTTGKVPEEKPIRYGDLTDAEFKKELRKYGYFRKMEISEKQKTILLRARKV